MEREMASFLFVTLFVSRDHWHRMLATGNRSLAKLVNTSKTGTSATSYCGSILVLALSEPHLTAAPHWLRSPIRHRISHKYTSVSYQCRSGCALCNVSDHYAPCPHYQTCPSFVPTSAVVGSVEARRYMMWVTARGQGTTLSVSLSLSRSEKIYPFTDIAEQDHHHVD